MKCSLFLSALSAGVNLWWYSDATAFYPPLRSCAKFGNYTSSSLCILLATSKYSLHGTKHCNSFYVNCWQSPPLAMFQSASSNEWQWLLLQAEPSVIPGIRLLDDKCGCMSGESVAKGLKATWLQLSKLHFICPSKSTFWLTWMINICF